MREEKATFGAGCFWGVEALFERMEGVKDAVSGYMGGEMHDPTYEQICSGTTGHAEVVEVFFDPEKTSYEELLDHFFRMHDPTTPNRQGVNIGSQYRSVVFYHNQEQRDQAMEFIRRLEDSKVFGRKIVTEVEPVKKFWKAEEFHQDFYQKKYQGGQGPLCHTLRPNSFLKGTRGNP